MLSQLLWVSLSFLAGIVAAPHVRLSLAVWAVLALVPALLLILQPRFWPSASRPEDEGAGPRRFAFIGRPLSSMTLLLVCLIAFSGGAARYQLSLPPTDVRQISSFNDRKTDVQVTGVLVDPPDDRDTYTNLRLQAQSIDTGKRQFQADGLLLVRVAPNGDYKYGQNVRVRGLMQTPPENEGFSYRDYLARQGVYSYMPNAEVTVLPGNSGNPLVAATYALKAKMLDNVYRIFVDPEASLLAGILLGVDSGLSRPLQEAFQETGTAHIIAISGSNIAIIAAIFVFLFGRAFGPRRGAAVAVLGIFFYTFLVGADPSVLRAAIMAALALVAVQLGRRQFGLNMLALVAAGMALLNPQWLWDVGFQLSFFATLGLLLYGPPLQAATTRFLGRYFPASRAAQLSGYAGEFVLLTLAAQLTTLPIMAYHFQQISLVSFIANPFILPAQPAVMILGGIAVLASLFVLPLGRLLALIAWPLAFYTIRTVEFFDSLPHGVIYLGSLSLGFVVLFYVVLFGLTFRGSQIRDWFNSMRQRFRFFTVTLVIASLFICTLLTWRLAGGGPDGKLHLTFLSVGSADAVLIQTPDGRHVLINGGSSVSALSDALGRRVSPLAPSLDWLILASTDENQVQALPRVLPRYPPQNVLLAGEAGASFSARDVVQWLDEHSIPIKQAEKDQLFDLGGGALLRVVDISTKGATLLVSWNDFHALLPIGEGLETLDALQMGAAIGPVDVISLADSGSAALTPPEWIDNLNPRLVVIDVAAGDPNKRPDKATLEVLAGRSVLRTDVNGWIDVSSDGTQMWVEVQRQPPSSE